MPCQRLVSWRTHTQTEMISSFVLDEDPVFRQCYALPQSTRYSSLRFYSFSFHVCTKSGFTSVSTCSCAEWTGMICTALLIFARQWLCVPEFQQLSVGFLDHKHGNIYRNIYTWNGQKTWTINIFVVVVGEIVHFFSALQQSGIFHAYNPLSRLLTQSA